MHGFHGKDATDGGPETTGLTLHSAVSYDLLTRLLGMGSRGRQTRMVIELAQVQRGDAVLDVACGTGSLTLAAAAGAGPGSRVCGIDASPEMIARARRNAVRAGASVSFELGLAEQLPFPDDSFDVVISRLAIHHLPEDLKPRVFAEILRVLKPGGHVLVADFTPPSNRLLWHMNALLLGPRMMRNDMRPLVALLAGAGFIEIASGPTRSAMLGFVGGSKPPVPS